MPHHHQSLARHRINAAWSTSIEVYSTMISALPYERYEGLQRLDLNTLVVPTRVGQRPARSRYLANGNVIVDAQIRPYTIHVFAPSADTVMVVACGEVMHICTTQITPKRCSDDWQPMQFACWLAAPP